MVRTLSIVFVALLFLAAGSGLVWYLSYGAVETPPGEVDVASLAAPVRIGWLPAGGAAIEATNEHDAYVALGYTHGMARTWNVVLWRQTALGRLAEWFGDDLLPVDRLARQLGLAAYAQDACARLSDEDRRLLEAYTDGLNAALSSRQAQMQSELVLLDLHPEPWQPWHTLALEHLFAWLAAPPPAARQIPAMGPDAAAFFQADDALRGWLHLNGFENSVAWAVADSAQTTFYQRHVYGASALPFLLEVALEQPGRGLVAGASLPGTPYLLAGKTRTHAWALLLSSSVQLVEVAQDTTVPLIYERLVDADHDEHLLSVRRDAMTIQFDPPPPALLLSRDTLAAAPDTTWTLRWAGLSPTSDWQAWRALPSDSLVAFRLFDGSGLMVRADGTWLVTGTPLVRAQVANGILVGNTAWSRYLAQRLDTLAVDVAQRAGVRQVVDDYQSPWAAELAPGLIAALDSFAMSDPTLQDARTYLRNWDYSYDPASIGASIFDTWMAAYRKDAGLLPQRAARDTTGIEARARYEAFESAVQTLKARLGSDLSVWRWEHVRLDQRFYPIWTTDTLGTVLPGLPTPSRYAPIELPGLGHPTTLAWGPSPIQEGRLAPASWEGWLSTATWDQFTVRRRYIDVDRFLGRALISDRPPEPNRLAPVPPAQHTTLLSPP